jgi:hypothetical protein
MRDANWHHLETFEVSFAAQIKAINPKAKVLVSRNSEVGTVVWDAIRPLLDTPEHAEASGLWLHNKQGKLSNTTWDCPNCGLPPKPSAIPYGKLYFNWTSAKFSDWWLATHIGSALDEPLIDGVYFDCCCGMPPGIPRGPEMPRFMGAAQAGFDRHLPVLAAKKKMTIAWNGEHISQRSCVVDMAKLHTACEYRRSSSAVGAWRNRGREACLAATFPYTGVDDCISHAALILLQTPLTTTRLFS